MINLGTLPTLMRLSFNLEMGKSLEFPYSRLQNRMYFYHCEYVNCRTDSVEHEDDTTSQEANDRLIFKAIQGMYHFIALLGISSV